MTRVLLIEDDAEIANLLRLYLETEGFQLTTTASPTEALRILTSEPLPDVILLDIMLPEVSGLELAPAIHQIAGPLPIIGMSASHRFAQAAGNEGDFILSLEKPFENIALVRDAIDQALR